MTKSIADVITCKAALVWKSGELVRVEEIKVEPPKGNEVRIKMICASLCHTDVLACNGLPVVTFVPSIPGHEGVGKVESVGEEVTKLKEGDTVMPLYLGECGECLNCKSGKSKSCHAYPLCFSGVMGDGTSRMSTTNGGEKIFHHFSCSTWSEYVVIDSNYVVKVDPRLSLPHASLLACGFTTGYGAPWKEAEVRKGFTVAVLGLGAVGLGVVEGANAQGAAKIIGIDINERKEEKGKAFGLTDFINPKQHPEKSVPDLIKEATGGLGVDYCFECTGVLALLNEAVEASKIIRTWDYCVIWSRTYDKRRDQLHSALCGRTLKGSIDKCISEEIELDQLSTHEIWLEEINDAFEILKQPDCVKVLIKF